MTGAPTPTKSLADALNQASATTPQTQQATPSGRLDMVAGDQSAFPQHGSDALPPPAGPNYSNTNLNALGNNWNVATGGTTGRSSTDALIGQNMAPYYQALGTSAGVGYMSADSSPDGQAHVRASAGGAQYLSNPDGTWSTLGQAPITSDQLKAKIAADGLGGVQAQTPSAPIVAKTALPGESAQDQVTRSAQGITSVKQPLNGIGAPEVLAPPNNGQPTPNAPVHIPSPAELPAPPPVAAIPSPLGPQNLPPQGEGPVQVGTGDPRDMARNGAPAGPLTGVTGNPGVASTGAGGAPPITGAPPVNALPSVALATQPSGAPLQPVAGPSTAPSLTPTNPATALTNQTIATPALQDRFKLALDQWQNAQAATNPQYEASLRDANRMAAAGGALGSGRLQTSIGDLANQRQLQMDTQKNTFLNDALGGSIQDAKDATQQANEQQNFQAGQQGTAFNQGVTKAQLGDNLKNSAFGRSLQQLLAGSSGDPSSILLALSQIFGTQSSAAGQALGQNVSQTTTNTRTAGSNNTLQDILNALRGGGATESPPVPSGTVPDFRPPGTYQLPNTNTGG